MATKKTVKEVIETFAEAELKAEKEAAATEVAEEPKAEEVKVEPKKPAEVPLFIPKGDEPFKIFCINGKITKVPRGKSVMVKPEIAYEWELSQKAEERLSKTLDSLKGGNA